MKISDRYLEYYAKYSLFNLKGPKSEVTKILFGLKYVSSLPAYLLLEKDYPLEAKTTPKELIVKSVQVLWTRLARFGQSGIISEPLMVSKFHKSMIPKEKKKESALK